GVVEAYRPRLDGRPCAEVGVGPSSEPSPEEEALKPLREAEPRLVADAGTVDDLAPDDAHGERDPERPTRDPSDGPCRGSFGRGEGSTQVFRNVGPRHLDATLPPQRRPPLVVEQQEPRTQSGLKRLDRKPWAFRDQ